MSNSSLTNVVLKRGPTVDIISHEQVKNMLFSVNKLFPNYFPRTSQIYVVFSE